MKINTQIQKVNNINSRYLIDRLEELENDLNDIQKSGTLSELSEWSNNHEEELQILQDVNKEGNEKIPLWNSGVDLIYKGNFKDYIRELFCDLGFLDNVHDWIASNVDWQGVADDRLVDYGVIQIDGLDFYYKG